MDDGIDAGLLALVAHAGAVLSVLDAAPSTHRHLRPTRSCWFCRPTDTGSLMAGGRYTNDRTSHRLHARACRRDLRAAGVRREPASNLPRRNDAQRDDDLPLAGCEAGVSGEI